MPRNNSNNGAVSRNIHTSNVLLNRKANRKGLAMKFQNQAKLSTLLSQAMDQKEQPSPIRRANWIIKGRPPQNWNLGAFPFENRYTIPPCLNNANIFEETVFRNHMLFRDVIRELHSYVKQITFYEDKDHEIEIM
jgi:hypothetical protein